MKLDRDTLYRSPSGQCCRWTGADSSQAGERAASFVYVDAHSKLDVPGVGFHLAAEALRYVRPWPKPLPRGMRL